MAHREGIREYLKDVDLTGKTVIDWGCGTKPIKKYLPGAAEYFSIDILDHVGADHVADICDFVDVARGIAKDKEYDIAFCLEALEHAWGPQQLLNNIECWLKPGGTFYFSVPFLYPIHSDHDLWRFTDQGLRFLLEAAGFIEIKIKSTTDSQEGWVGQAKKPL